MMASTKLSFHGTLIKSDPQQKPVLIIGQVKHLALLKFDDVKCKLEPRVSVEVSFWERYFWKMLIHHVYFRYFIRPLRAYIHHLLIRALFT